MVEYLTDQFYHANWIIFFLIVIFNYQLGKKNMSKEVRKIHDQIRQAEQKIVKELGKRR